MARLHIILVDDDPDDCLILSHIVKEILPGCELTCFDQCSSFTTYLESFNSDQHTCTSPDLILLDLNMPVTTGQECLKKIRKNNICTNVPVIIYSTAYRADIVEECYRIGANSYVVKPSEINKLKDMLRSVVERFVYVNKSNNHL